MTKGGPKRKPTHLRLLEGDRGKRGIRRGTAVAHGDLTTPPEWLSDEQKAGWRYAIENAPAGLLKKLDHTVLICFVVAEDLHRHACIQVAKFGMVTKSPVKGDPMQNPYLAIVNKQALIMLRAAAEMGFTPASRSGVTISDDGDGEAENPLAKYNLG